MLTSPKSMMDKQTFQEYLDIWFVQREPTNEYVHPTQKPIELAARAIRNSSKMGDIIVDLFGGSGSTLIAAHQLGRIAYLMELDPHYCDVIRDRWEKHGTKEKST